MTSLFSHLRSESSFSFLIFEGSTSGLTVAAIAVAASSFSSSVAALSHLDFSASSLHIAKILGIAVS